MAKTAAAGGWQSRQGVWWTRELRGGRPAAERRRGGPRRGCPAAFLVLATGGGGGPEETRRHADWVAGTLHAQLACRMDGVATGSRSPWEDQGRQSRVATPGFTAELI